MWAEELNCYVVCTVENFGIIPCYMGQVHIFIHSMFPDDILICVVYFDLNSMAETRQT